MSNHAHRSGKRVSSVLLQMSLGTLLQLAKLYLGGGGESPRSSPTKCCLDSDPSTYGVFYRLPN